LQLSIAEKIGIPCVFGTKLTPADLHNTIVIDAIFGIGLSRTITGEIAAIIRLVNNAAPFVVAVDIPTGIHSDTGEVMGEAIVASQTVTFGIPKRGHYLYPGAHYSGKLTVADIGFPPAFLTDDRIAVNLVAAASVRQLVPERPSHAYKNMFGHVLVVAGSTGKTGAALLTARACLRSGAGLVTLGVPESLLDVFMGSVTEEMLLPLPDTGNGELAPFAAPEILRMVAERFDIVAIGPGLGRSTTIGGIVTDLVLACPAPLVIDADGLYALSAQTSLLQSAKAPIVLTPHAGELKRLCSDKDQQYVHRDRIETARAFAAEHGVYLVAKGAPTIVATPESRPFVTTAGNSGMATPGAGDVLTGIIAGLLAQHLTPEAASILGVFLHGAAGDHAAARLGRHSLIATDIIASLPDAFCGLNRAEVC
jgi:NAD(P)H-hydrate epimerase